MSGGEAGEGPEVPVVLGGAVASWWLRGEGVKKEAGPSSGEWLPGATGDDFVGEGPG